jgi:hypothetical protein
VRPAAAWRVAVARLSMFEFVVIVYISLPKRSARGTGDGVNIRRLLYSVKHFFKNLSGLFSAARRVCLAGSAEAILGRT